MRRNAVPTICAVVILYADADVRRNADPFFIDAGSGAPEPKGRRIITHENG